MDFFKNKHLSLIAVTSCCVIFPTTVFANLGYFELSGGFGALYSQLGNNSVAVTSTETDNLRQNYNPQVGDGNIGLGYVIPLLSAHDGLTRQYFPFIKPAVNLRYFSRDVGGQVYQYQQTGFDNYTYDLSVTSTRLMFDVTLGLLEYQHFNLHAISGLGAGWTQIGYSDSPNAGVQGGGLSLNRHKRTGFVSEVGAGVGYEIDSRFSVALDYLYANYGSVKTSSTGTLNGAPETIIPMTFPLRTQEVLFEVNLKL